MNKPQFIIIGAQKCGTTWLWKNIKRHPGADLGNEKEVNYFSNSKNYRKGRDWYYSHFRGLDSSKLLGEASTYYFYDYPFSNGIDVDTTLPVIPNLVRSELPDVKILLILRDPIQRLISAYYHCLKIRWYPPHYGLLEAAQKAPIAKLIERSSYARYLSLWRQYFPPEQLHCMVFEEDILLHPEDSISQVYAFLGLDVNFKPDNLRKSENKGWTWSHLVMGYYLPGYRYAYSALRKLGMEPLLMRINFLKKPEFKREEIETLRNLFLPEKKELEVLLNRDLGVWKYGLE